MAEKSRTLKLSILGDIDQLKKSLATGTKEVNGFAGKLGDFSKKAAAAFAVAGVAAAAYAGKLLVDGVKAAIADEKANALLANTLRNVAGATDQTIKSTLAYTRATELATGVTEDELRPSLNRLTIATGDVQKAIRLQTLALDVSAGSGKSLEAVTQALAKAQEGNTASLGRLGVGLTAAQLKTMSMDDVTKSLAKTFEGAAATSADTYEGKMKRLGLAFEDVRDTVGGFVLDAITPMVEKIVKNVMPALAGFADGLGKSLGPTLANITKIVRDDLLPILISWWKFLYNEVIPAIGSVVRPILEGLSSAFNTIRNAVKNNSTELKPFYDVLKLVWGFIKNNLAPLLGGAFKLALETIGTIVGGLVTGFSKLVGFITSTVNKMKEFVNFVKDNPVTRFFFGSGNASGASFTTSQASQGLVFAGEDGSGGGFGGGGFGGGGGVFALSPDSPTFTGAPLEAYSPAMQAAILRREELKAETERLRQAREAAAAARTAATGGLSTAERIVINVNAASVIDEEGFNRAIVSALNNSTFRGTNGPGSLVAV
jgi:hypothetical protein